MLAMVLALAAAQGPVTPAAPLRYRLEAKTSSEQDLTSVGKGKVAGSLATTAVVTITFADSAEGQTVRVTVDSMKLEPTGAMTQSLPLNAAGAVGDSTRGAFVRAYVVHGSMRGGAQASTPSPALATIMQAMPVLFPGLRTGIKIGDSWADTTFINNDVASGHQSGRVVATWKVTGADRGGLILEGTATNTVTTKAQNGQTLHVSGTSQEHLVMAAHGPTRSASIESSNDISMTSPQNATPIPARSVGSLRVIPLP